MDQKPQTQQQQQQKPQQEQQPPRSLPMPRRSLSGEALVAYDRRQAQKQAEEAALKTAKAAARAAATAAKAEAAAVKAKAAAEAAEAAAVAAAAASAAGETVPAQYSSDEGLAQIRRSLIDDGETLKTIAKRYGTSPQYLGKFLKRFCVLADVKAALEQRRSAALERLRSLATEQLEAGQQPNASALFQALQSELLAADPQRLSEQRLSPQQLSARAGHLTLTEATSWLSEQGLIGYAARTTAARHRLTGTSYGDWTILRWPHPTLPVTQQDPICRCSCGTERPVSLHSLQTSSSLGCGCRSSAAGQRLQFKWIVAEIQAEAADRTADRGLTLGQELWGASAAARALGVQVMQVHRTLNIAKSKGQDFTTISRNGLTLHCNLQNSRVWL